MIHWLENIDRKLFLFLNSINNSLFDKVMVFISGSFLWILVIILFLYFAWRKYGKNMWLPVVLIAICFIMTDQLSNLIKHAIARFRPTYNMEISTVVHTVNGYKGGLYGFVSSHAANSFGIALLSALLVRNRFYTITIFVWASVVSYSRIYLGVHYPSDIAGGLLLGISIALSLYLLAESLKFTAKLLRQSKTSHKDKV